MATIKEPNGIDFLVKSEPWTEAELIEFRKLMDKKKMELGEKKRAEINETFRKATESTHHA